MVNAAHQLGPSVDQLLTTGHNTMLPSASSSLFHWVTNGMFTKTTHEMRTCRVLVRSALQQQPIVP